MVIGFNGKHYSFLNFESYSCGNKVNSGEVDDDLNFSYEKNTEVYESCAASLNGEMWVLGSNHLPKQVPAFLHFQ